ncbi:hypothetical protein SK63_02152 [Enterobacter sp. BIDMC110]|nr:hypothetical protein SK63_02152 [Enterobacter sp. BIDMC110]
MFTSSTDNLGDMNLVRLRYLSGLFPGGAALTGATKVRVGRVRRSRHPVFFSVQAIRQRLRTRTRVHLQHRQPGRYEPGASALRLLSGLFPGGAALTGATKVRVGRVRRSRHPAFFSVQAIRQRLRTRTHVHLQHRQPGRYEPGASALSKWFVPRWRSAYRGYKSTRRSGKA